AVSLFLTTRADRIGRRRMLVIGALLMVAAGLVFASTRTLWLLVLAGTIGVISPSGHEVGPFLSIEQAALSHVVTDRTRTEVVARDGGVDARGEEEVPRHVCGALRTRAVARSRREALGAVRTGLVRRRFRRPELRSVLVLSAIRRKSWDARCDLLLGEHLRRD